MDANDLGVFEDYIEAADEIEQESAWLSLEENEEIRINPNFNADVSLGWPDWTFKHPPVSTASPRLWTNTAPCLPSKFR